MKIKQIREREEAWEESEAQDNLTSQTINRQLKDIQKYLKKHGVILNTQQILRNCISEVWATVKDDVDMSRAGMIAHLKDVTSGGMELEAYEYYLLGEYVSLSAWAKENNLDSGNARRYAKAGRIPGARKSGDVWLIPKNAKPIYKNFRINVDS